MKNCHFSIPHILNTCGLFSFKKKAGAQANNELPEPVIEAEEVTVEIITAQIADADGLETLIAAESRENVKTALQNSKRTIDALIESINQLIDKKEEMTLALSKQKSTDRINKTIEKYRQRLREAKAAESMGTAKTYAFMITKQKRNLDMMDKIRKAIGKISDKVTVLTHLNEDLIETALDLPIEADLMGSMEVINMAMGEVHNVDAIMGEVTSIEDELRGLAIETELSSQTSALDIDSLPADVRAEIERELEG